MKFQKYTKYKASGVDWLGEVPEEWEENRIDWISKIVRGNSSFKKDELLNKGKYIALQYGKTYKVDEVNKTFSFYVNDEFYKSEQIVNSGDIILVSTSETLEDLGHSCFYARDDLGLIGGEQILLKPNRKILFEKYLYYYSKVFSKGLRKYATGLKVFRFSTLDLKNLFLPLPPKQTQTKIANYLDEKTNLINKKISLLQKKKQKYKELKQTLINEVVTKGLDKNVKMKESDIEWIGEIPEHWEVKRVKEIFAISRGRVIAQTELKDKGYPVYSSQTENKGCMGFIETYDFDNNLITWTTDGVNAGTVFLREGKFNCTNICGILIPKRKKELDLRYFEHSVQVGAKHNKRIDTNGAKIMSNEMSIIKITIPPKQEQIQIANYLDEKTKKIDDIMEKIDENIATLKEFRKTLINDAVTGKIKVA